MKNPSFLNPIAGDVQREYVKYRRAGKSRAAAIEQIFENYTNELEDEDDRLAVLIGLSLALCKKNEFVEALAVQTRNEIRRAYQNAADDDKMTAYLNELDRYLANESLLGDEALYKQTSKYVPEWEIGDLFCHTLTYPAAEALGIMGWSILLYKVGEHVDEFEEHLQLMYVSLCPPDQLPSCENDMEKLVFLRMMQLGERSEYLAQITIKSRRTEKSYGLTKIGCYPKIVYPKNCVEENPLTAMPLFGYFRKSDQWPGFEDQICRLYRKFGLK